MGQIIQFSGKSSAGGGSIIVTTASALINLINTNSVVPGQLYQFPYSMVWLLGGTIGPIYKQNGLDSFQILGTSNNTFASTVNSTLFANLVIQFTFNIPFGWVPPQWFGYVENIIDPSQNTLNIGGDYRFLQWRRWNDGSGNFTVTSDNGNSFQDLPVFTTLGTTIIIDNLITSFQNTIISNFDQNIVRDSFFQNSNIGNISNSQIYALNITNMSNGNISNSSINNAICGNMSVLGCINSDIRKINVANASNCGFGNSSINDLTVTNGNNIQFTDSKSTGNIFTNASIVNVINSDINGINITNPPLFYANKCNVSNYVLVNDSFGLTNDATFLPQAQVIANVVTLAFQVNLSALAIGTSTTGLILSKGMRVKTTFIKNNTGAGAGTFSIGSTTQPQSMCPNTAFPLTSFNYDNIVFDFLAASENITITKVGASTGILDIYVTLNNIIQ
jgi:hypothetical protein